MCALLLAACRDADGSVDAPAPLRMTGGVDSLPSLPAGTIVAPLALQLHAAVVALERIVPTLFGSMEQRIPIPDSRKSYAYEIKRGAFKVRFANDTVVFTSIIQYQGRAWFDPPIGPTLNGECGTDGTPPRARLVLHAIPRLSPDWRLRVRTRVAELVPLSEEKRDRCEVTVLKLDVTEKVLAILQGMIGTMLPGVERRVARLDIRTPLARIWGDLQKPIRLRDSLWLLLEPRSVRLGEVEGSTRLVAAEVGLSATPRIVTGSRPIFTAQPLPQLGDLRTEPGFVLLLEGAFDYDVMSAELTRRLSGQNVRAGGGTFRVRQAVLYGTGGGRLALGLDFEGTTQGRIWLTGKPAYDPATGVLSVPDLDFDASSAGLLVRGLAWLKGDAIRGFLREHAVLQVRDVLRDMEELAMREMNREVVRGVRLSALIERSEPAGILIRPDRLILRARAIGEARLDLLPELFRPDSAR